MAYRCDQAIIGGARDAIRCKVSGTVCAHQKMCMMEGRIVLTDKKRGRKPAAEKTKETEKQTTKTTGRKKG